jgi:hypothetical protein
MAASMRSLRRTPEPDERRGLEAAAAARTPTRTVSPPGCATASARRRAAAAVTIESALLSTPSVAATPARSALLTSILKSFPVSGLPPGGALMTMLKIRAGVDGVAVLVAVAVALAVPVLLDAALAVGALADAVALGAADEVAEELGETLTDALGVAVGVMTGEICSPLQSEKFSCRRTPTLVSEPVTSSLMYRCLGFSTMKIWTGWGGA